MPVAFDFSHQGYSLVTLYVQFLCSDWSKFDRWVHAENLCSILKLVYFDSWSWQSFVSTCDFFNCLFPLHVQNEKQLLSRVFVFVFHFAWCVRGFKSLKRFWSYLIAFRSCISNGKPEQLLYLMFVFLRSRYENATPNLWFGCPLQLIREVFSRLHSSSSSSTHICFALRRLVTFCLTLTR